MITVTEFLREVLKPAPAEAVAWCCQFESYSDQLWNGAACTPETAPEVNGANAYYSISAFKHSAEHRRKEDAEGACVVLCDDVGTKVPPAKVLGMLGEPSFKIHTSPQSRQWGYLLTALASDEELRPIHDRLLALGLCDRNGNNLVRYGRLPAGVNNKPAYAEPFPVRCEEWHPARRFSIEDIGRRLSGDGADEFEALAAQIESGEDYHEPLMKLGAKYAARGYAERDIVNILQGHMFSSPDRSERWKARFDDILRTVKTAVEKFAPADRGDVILIRGGESHEAALAALGVLARRGIATSIFARGAGLWRPYIAERTDGFNNERVQSLELNELNAHALAFELDGLVSFRGLDKKGRATLTDCPAKLAATLLSIQHRWEALPRLHTIAAVPIYCGAGRLVTEPGYHSDLRAWLTVPAGVRIPAAPTRGAAEAALARLHEWIAEFPAASETDRAVLLAGMLTAALRPSLPTAPGFAIDAPEFGSGKSTAAKLLNIIMTGRQPSVMQFDQNGADELRKHIQAAMLAGRQSIVIDNVPTGVVLTSPVLAQLLTEPIMDIRELGASKTHSLP